MLLLRVLMLCMTIILVFCAAVVINLVVYSDTVSDFSDRDSLMRQHVLEDNHSDKSESLDKEPTNDRIPSVTRLCSQAERLYHMTQVCSRWNPHNHSNLTGPAARSLVDNKHKLLYCFISKAGCTAFKALIFETNGISIKEQSETDAIQGIHHPGRFGIKQMGQLLPGDQEEVIQDFFKVFIIRHPFDRLLSYYRDKLVETDRISAHLKRQHEILRFTRPDRQPNRTSETGPPSFNEFMQWLHTFQVQDEHWNLIHEACHTCVHDWDAILRIETMETDGGILLDLLNLSQRSIPVRHSHSEQHDYRSFSKALPEYSTVSGEVIDYLLDLYRVDMEMFGYKWDVESRTAYCVIETAQGDYCC